MSKSEQDSIAFRNAADLGAWLTRHHQRSNGIWVRIFKKGSGKPSVTWGDCVIEAIRFGWIDGHKRPLDEASYLQRLTPRKPKSNWSARNRDHATRLIAEGRMTPAGLAHVEAAKADGRWDGAYEGSATMTIPQDFLDALETRPAAKAFFGTLDRRNLFPIYYRLHTAKRPETRARRLAQILDQLDRGERFH
ncbi:MAG: YdeI/OmpD-associated family protein [Bauldia sp.]|nr:YdeI/OmpD-associated family protein [Bauldia sp.]